MRLVKVDEMVQISLDLFTRYIEPLACSFMYGEVPTSAIMIHRTGNYDNGWFTKVHFKNTISISVFRCEIYLHDIMAMCRDCNMWLIDESVFTVAVLFSMMYPLYQTQHMDFSKEGVDQGYDTMIVESAKETYDFIKTHYDFKNELEYIVLDTIYYHNMRVNQLWKYFPTDKESYFIFDDLFMKYKNYMMLYYREAYKTAIKRKAQDYLVDENGFILLERLTAGETKYEQEPDPEEMLDKAPELKKEEIEQLRSNYADLK